MGRTSLAGSGTSVSLVLHDGRCPHTLSLNHTHRHTLVGQLVLIRVNIFGLQFKVLTSAVTMQTMPYSTQPLLTLHPTTFKCF